MLNFLKKLDRMAEAWIGTMDEQLQEPIVRSLTREVFSDGTNDHIRGSDAPVMKAEICDDNTPSGDLAPTPTDTAYPPLQLRPDALLRA